ncbi:ADP-ribose pyrophosphatase YjhB, NUDIX family [Pseudooceanicola antarcticus]|uniref:ADP-ribose pyrophosphatase YjhB, NUDIX family n=1 Tax=Pseudooceanicola antarcticus TaxID=1247613 RepID=A0A285JET8_9RHOB|nr:NUDIX hydrolase [Pseudooceanicola antarcticus]PJE31056.1 NUDIX domain-containing protein [Pseudooceanicola antarcticus]SNY58778.1 ADP-ribose pyrophosphatase YjhB, NUDIX family [Pseudooceanicola antarcticus]
MPAAPSHPVPAVLSVALRDDEVLLVRRANPPDAGLWGFPGGKVDLGETLSAAALRELEEETGLRAQSAGPVLGTEDVILADESGEGLAFHYVLIALLCSLPEDAPVPRAADDALEAAWVPLAEIAELPCSAGVLELARRALSQRDAAAQDPDP